MSPSTAILLVTADATTAKKVALAVESDSRLAPVSVCRDIGDLAARLEHERQPAAIVDIDPDPLRMLAELAPVIARNPETRFVALCSSLHTDVILAAMQAGTRHFMQKADIDSDLAATLRRLIPDGPLPAYGHGSVVVVLSASGGTGATTVAVNLANELRLASSSKVLLVDMDLSYGAVSSYLGVQGTYGLADVLAHSNGADPQLVKSSAQVVSENLHVLLSPASVDGQASGALEYGNLGKMLEACRRAYLLTVVDAPHLPTNLAAKLAAMSNFTLIVLQMTVKDIQYARALHGAIVRSGVLSSRVFKVVNRYGKKSRMISLDECEQALGEENMELIRNDYRSAIRGINLGKPLAEAAPMSALRKDVRKLSEKLARLAAPALFEEET